MNVMINNNLRLIGYDKTFLFLKNLHDQNNLPNKMIFSGNKGIGKSTLAYHVINYIFSQKEDYIYNCEKNLILENNKSFNLVNKNCHPNFFLITNEDDKLNIQISKIREMIDFTNKSTFNNDYKIILIDNIEYLNKSSINALLKVIEEPNDKIYFFLIHNNNLKILDTLRSRCTKFNLYLKNEDKYQIINSILNNNFYKELNNDFINEYNTPGNIISLHNFFSLNNIENSISIEELLKLIIIKSLYKKDLYLKKNLNYLIELFFIKKINEITIKSKMYFHYKYFLSKIHNCYKYNLDMESILIEFNRKILNG